MKSIFSLLAIGVLGFALTAAAGDACRAKKAAAESSVRCACCTCAECACAKCACCSCDACTCAKKS